MNEPKPSLNFLVMLNILTAVLQKYYSIINNELESISQTLEYLNCQLIRRVFLYVLSSNMLSPLNNINLLDSLVPVRTLL
jgi:hypothetical protein